MTEFSSGFRAVPPIGEQAQRKLRARSRKTGKLLHLSGQGEVDSETYAWFGTRAQFEALRERNENLSSFVLVRREPYLQSSV